MKISNFKTNVDGEKNGVWVDYAEGTRFKIASVESPAYTRRLTELCKPHRNRIKSDRIDPEVLEKLVIQAFSEHILLGWEGLEGDDGSAIEYSPSKAKELLTNYPRLFRDIREIANDEGIFQLKATEADAGN